MANVRPIDRTSEASKVRDADGNGAGVLEHRHSGSVGISLISSGT